MRVFMSWNFQDYFHGQVLQARIVSFCIPTGRELREDQSFDYRMVSGPDG